MDVCAGSVLGICMKLYIVMKGNVPTYRVPPLFPFLNVFLPLDNDCSFSSSYVILDGTWIVEEAKHVG